MPDPGDRLIAALADRYTIERELGQGGMATVYLAADLKHDRKVAVKVLRPELAAVLGADRFVQEIKTTASLQHPHILPLFDSGEADGFLFYVMPYIEGETLRDRLNRDTQLGVDEAVKIATEVADALGYAHGHGVIHRDIKPENILLHNNRPMIADFGIALAVSAAAGGRMTETGMSLGTPHYMSPEQATADKDVTARSDIYSLGTVLYEMLTGDPPHTGSSAQQIIMRIVTDEPRPVTDLRRSVPPNVAAAIATSLEKVPADRFPTAERFAAALADHRFVGSSPRRPSPGGATLTLRTTRVWQVLTVLTAVVAALGWLRPTSSPPTVLDARRLNVVLPDSAPLALGTGRPALALSADGNNLVYVSRASGVNRLAIRDLSSGTHAIVPGSDRATGPFLSRSGRVGFFAPDGVMTTDVNARAARLEAQATSVTRGAAWVDDTTVIRVGSPNSPVSQQIVNGAPESSARSTARASETGSRWPTGGGWLVEQAHAWPTALPGGGILFAIAEQADPDGWQIAAAERGATSPRVLVDGGSHPTYVSPGYLVFLRFGALWAVRFDADRLEVTGEPVRMVNDVLTEAGGLAHYSIADSGTLVYAAGSDWRGSRYLVWVSRDGTIDTLPVPAGPYTDLAVSPDNRMAAVTRAEGSNYDVWVGDLTRGALTSVTSDPGEDGSPVWSPDGRRLAIATEQGGSSPHLAIHRIGTEGLTVPIAPHAAGGWPFTPPTGWSGDTGDIFVTYMERQAGARDTDISVVSAESGAVSPWLESPSDLRSATPSPDGNWVAFVSNESGRDEVYVSARDAPGIRVLASLASGADPRWGRTTGALYFREGDRVLSVTVTPGDDDVPVASPPTVAFHLPASLYLEGSFNSASWDISRDERRILALEEAQSAHMTVLNVVTNWTAELREELPGVP